MEEAESVRGALGWADCGDSNSTRSMSQRASGDFGPGFFHCVVRNLDRHDDACSDDCDVSTVCCNSC